MVSESQWENKSRLSCLGTDDYAIDIGATTHLTMNQDIELALRFTTDIKNGAEFFTDLNGFQVIEISDH